MLVETRAAGPSRPKSQGRVPFVLAYRILDTYPERALPRPRNFVDSGLHQVGSSSQSLSNLPRSASFNSSGNPGRGLRRQRSGAHRNCFVTDWPTDATQRWLYPRIPSPEITCSSILIGWKHRMTKWTVGFTHTRHI